MEAIRRAFERGWGAANARDPDGLLALYHPEVVMRTAIIDPGQEERVGIEGVRALFEEIWATWSKFEGQIEQMVIEPPHAIAIVRLVTTTVESGLTFEQRYTQVGTLRDGLVIRQASYIDLADGFGEFARLLRG